MPLEYISYIEYNKRTSQNVVFEAGYFIGRLGIENVIISYEDGVELPGDLGGCVYVKLSGSEEWKESLRIEFEEMHLI